MARKIERVAFAKMPMPTRENVAAYARVSSGKDEMLHSLSSQVSYYRDLRGKQYCASKQIPETTLQYHTALVTEDISTIAKILAAPNNTLIYRLKDGSEVIQHWEDRSRAKSWTPEMRQAAKEKALAQRQEVK